jgi:cobalt-zinc-cadmium resistance protein CzcA
VIKSLLVFGLTRSAIIVLGLFVFCAAGLVAFTKLNIEAYPNPAPVILEITAQAAGLSAEEMEKYYTIPMEVGLYPTPGVVNVRSTSFYGLSFVRVTFAYGIDYYFALTQASISLQQNVTLPGNLVPTIPPAFDHPGCGADQQLGRHDQAVQRRCRPAEARGLQYHRAAGDQRAR